MKALEKYNGWLRQKQAEAYMAGIEAITEAAVKKADALIKSIRKNNDMSPDEKGYAVEAVYGFNRDIYAASVELMAQAMARQWPGMDQHPLTGPPSKTL